VAPNSRFDILHLNAEAVPNQADDPTKKEALPSVKLADGCHNHTLHRGTEVVEHKCGEEEEDADCSVLDEAILDPVTLEVWACARGRACACSSERSGDCACVRGRGGVGCVLA
jgi:hypothetical protein